GNAESQILVSREDAETPSFENHFTFAPLRLCARNHPSHPRLKRILFTTKRAKYTKNSGEILAFVSFVSFVVPIFPGFASSCFPLRIPAPHTRTRAPPTRSCGSVGWERTRLKRRLNLSPPKTLNDAKKPSLGHGS